jgi:hypothetical protein
MAANHPLTLAFILESGDQVVILEGVAAAVTGAGRLQAFLDAYNPKHDWDAAATDEGVTDSAGAAGPAYRVRPRVVFGWDVDMRAPTRWSFTDSIANVERHSKPLNIAGPQPTENPPRRSGEGSQSGS